jgi:hypothetical protein
MENNDKNPEFQGGSTQGQGPNANKGNQSDNPNTEDLVGNTSNQDSSSNEFPKNGSRENKGYAEKDPTQGNQGETGGGRGNDTSQTGENNHGANPTEGNN